MGSELLDFEHLEPVVGGQWRLLLGRRGAAGNEPEACRAVGLVYGDELRIMEYSSRKLGQLKRLLVGSLTEASPFFVLY